MLSSVDTAVDKTASPDLTTTTKTNFTDYNALGQNTAFYQTVTEKGAVGDTVVDSTTITVRSKNETRYDKFGRLAQYHDIITDAKGVVTDKLTTGISPASNIAYDDATGRMIAYREVYTTEGVVTVKDRAIDAGTGL